MKRDNIFLIASNAANGKYGPEDLLTDSLGALLTMDKPFARAWFEKLSGIKPADVLVTTQPPFPDYPHDAPDMLLESEAMVLVCEHKLGAPFGKDQLQRYLALVQKEQTRTGIPHRLVVVGDGRLSVPGEVLQGEHYSRPANQERHFSWKDAYDILRQLQEQDKTALSPLRTQFMEYLRVLGVAPVAMVGNLPRVHAHNTLQEKAQQSAFGEAWSPTRNWLEEKGFRTMPSSRTGLYIFPTPFSEITNHRGVHHVLVSPSEKMKLPRRVDIELPVLNCTVSVDQENHELAKHLGAVQKSHLRFLTLPLAINRLASLQGRHRISLAVSLGPLFQTGNLPGALLSVIQEIYTDVLLPAFSLVN